MNNFFSNLISRSQTTDLQVMPRPIARFEPVGVSAALPFDAEIQQHERTASTQNGQSEAFVPPDAPPSTTPRAEAMPIETRRAAPPRHDEPVRHDDNARSADVALPTESQALLPRILPQSVPDLSQTAERITLPATPSTAHALHQSQQPGDEAHEARQAIQRTQIAPIIHERAQVIIEQHVIEQRSAASRAPQQAILLPEQPQLLDGTPRHAEQRSATPERPSDQHRPVMAPRSRQEPRAALTIQPKIEPLVGRASPTAQRDTSVPAPIIQVTIGRIEVRATPPSSQPSRQRTQAAIMSLDEYLRQRSQGGSS